MSMRIVAAAALSKIILEADEEGFRFQDSPGFGMGENQRHAYREIDAILRDATNPGAPTLSIQVGAKIYRIGYKSYEQKHCAVVDFIVEKTARTREAS